LIVGPDVVRIRYEIGEDCSGQWSIFFRVVLTDGAVHRRLRDVATKVVRELTRQLDFPGLGVFRITISKRIGTGDVEEPARA
jgi:hypothetical protein